MSARIILSGTVSLAALFAASAAHGQTSAPAPDAAATSTEAEPDDIIVTGIRESLRASIEAKRDLGIIAEVITAEDIGKFPDKNVAEALQRVPGISINREFGEGERVSLRGTPRNFTKTLLNGHAIATADWFVLEQLAATRSFNYLTLPSEIIGQLQVYKTAQADIEEGGIGGTINVNTRKPLDLNAFTISASAQVVYSEKRDSLDPQFSGLVSWKNADETFGIVLGGNYQKRDIRRDGVEVLGYFNPENDPAGSALVPSLIGSALFEQERERYGGNIGLQFKPSDDLEINLTGLYSKFNADNINQNFLAWGQNALGGGGTLSNFVVRDGTVVSGRIDSTATGRAVVYDAIDRTAFAETWSADADLVWHPSDEGTLHLKGGYTKANGNTQSQPFYEGGAPGGFTFDLTGRTPQVNFIGFDPTDPSDLVFDFGSLNKITNADSETYFYVDYEHKVDLSGITAFKVGGKFTDHQRQTRFLATTYGGFFLPLQSMGCGGPCDSTDFFGGQTPNDFLENVALSGTLRKFWTVDRERLRNIYNGQPANVRARIINPPENFDITEKTYGGYAMMSFGGDNWRGNAGVRVIRTDQRSSGNLIGVPPGPGTINDNAFGVYLPVTVERDYTDVLPSFNVSFDLDPTLILRAGIGRSVVRPDYTDVVPRITLNPGSRTAAGGDPLVDPFRANNYDVSLEWYPDRDTIFAAAVFYKDVESYITDRISREIFPVQTSNNTSGCTVVSAAQNLYNCPFDVNRRANTPGGRTLGFEVQATRAIYAGFGATVNYTYSDANAANGIQVPDNSKHTVNVTGFFENRLLSARVSYNYRSEFFISFDRAAPLNQKDLGSLDASASINITPNIALTADAINLTNEKIEQFSATRVRPRAIYDNGRQFYFGARFRF